MSSHTLTLKYSRSWSVSRCLLKWAVEIWDKIISLQWDRWRVFLSRRVLIRVSKLVRVTLKNSHLNRENLNDFLLSIGEFIDVNITSYSWTLRFFCSSVSDQIRQDYSLSCLNFCYQPFSSMNFFLGSTAFFWIWGAFHCCPYHYLHFFQKLFKLFRLDLDFASFIQSSQNWSFQRCCENYLRCQNRYGHFPDEFTYFESNLFYDEYGLIFHRLGQLQVFQISSFF